jgi:hypothetical protein
MKSCHTPIQVEVGDDGLPYSFRWRNRAWNVISVTDRWVLQAGWWRSDGTEKRDYVLVEAEGMDGGACSVELYLGVDGWMLGRVMA